MEKNFALRADQIRTLVEDLGSAVASDRITVDGAKVGYMYREAPDNDVDSGWRFLAGDEDEVYMEDASRFGIYAINTIANYDPEIIRLLDEPEGSAFIRIGGKLISDA